jgi:predicted PhzF superfamily epimerase YddE/YHI9
MSALQAIASLRCMYSDTAAGGVADVHWLADASPLELTNAAEKFFNGNNPNDTTQVFVTGRDGRFVAESYSATGRRIQFCGHGALAAARLVFDQHAAGATECEFSNAAQSWQARCSAERIALTYSQPLPEVCSMPAFAKAALGVQPLAAATVGGPSGYLLLQLADAASLKSLQPDYALITAATERALIVTAQADNIHLPGCVFRYFAPQYGPPEDAATGSAAIQLAAFWSPRFDGRPFTAWQLSPQGAEMQLSCTGETVDLTARVGYLERHGAR